MKFNVVFDFIRKVVYNIITMVIINVCVFVKCSSFES